MQILWRLHTVVWELTRRCNLACLHCGSSCGPVVDSSAELSGSEAADVVGQIAGLGGRRIVLSGGEPFLCPHWRKVVQWGLEAGVQVDFMSNGTGIDAAVARELSRHGGRVSVGLSLDGACSVTHDALRGTPGVFDKVLAAIGSLVKNGAPVSVITSVHRGNLAELADLHELLTGRGVFAWQLQPVLPAGRMNPAGVLDRIGLDCLARFIVKARREGRLRVEAGDSLCHYSYGLDGLRVSRWEGCQAGLRSLGIRSNGKVVGCLSLQGTPAEGDLRRERLSRIWHDPDRFALNRKFIPRDLKGPCRDCAAGAVCRGGCAFVAHALSGEYHHVPLCEGTVNFPHDSDREFSRCYLKPVVTA